MKVITVAILLSPWLWAQGCAEVQDETSLLQTEGAVKYGGDHHGRTVKKTRPTRPVEKAAMLAVKAVAGFSDKKLSVKKQRQRWQEQNDALKQELDLLNSKLDSRDALLKDVIAKKLAARKGAVVEEKDKDDDEMAQKFEVLKKRLDDQDEMLKTILSEERMKTKKRAVSAPETRDEEASEVTDKDEPKGTGNMDPLLVSYQNEAKLYQEQVTADNQSMKNLQESYKNAYMRQIEEKTQVSRQMIQANQDMFNTQVTSETGNMGYYDEPWR